MPARREGRKPTGRSGRSPSPPPLAARLARQHWPFAVAVLLVGAGGVLGLALIFPGGSIATPLNALQGRLLGWTAPLLALWLTTTGVILFAHHLRPDTRVPWQRGTGALITSVALVALAGLTSYGAPEPDADAAAGSGGGQVGLVLARLFGDALGPVGSGVLLALLLLGGVVVALEIPPARVVRAAEQLTYAVARLSRTAARRLRRPVPPTVPSQPGLRQRLAERVRRRRAERQALPGDAAPAEAASAPPRPRARSAPAAPDSLPAGPLGTPPAPSPWRLPPLSLLELPSSPVLAPVDLQQRARIIQETLESFNISARVVEINAGPTVTQFGVEPAMGVTVSRIVARTNDLALRLGA